MNQGMIKSLSRVTMVTVALFAVGCTGSSEIDETTRDESGTIVEQGEVGAFRIQLGDCLDRIGTALVESANGVSCDDDHQYEVYHAFDLTGVEYPGDEIIGEQAETGCRGAFSSFVALQPVKDSWDSVGDREVLCLIGHYDGSIKTGSARATAI